jgi:lysophospholipase L1-like esterase
MLVRSTRVVGAIAAAVGLFAVAAGPAAAAKPKPVTPGSTYLALGDSVPFGYQESTVVPAPNYARASSFVGYPELLGAGLRLKVVNAACPGETSASFINASAASNGCENAPAGKTAYRARFPLHVRYKGSQLAFAVKFLRKHPDTRLVSLMIGANDYFLCQATTSDSCASPAEANATVAKITANVRRILSAIRHKAHYRGRLAIVEYYSLDYASPAVNALLSSFNRAIHKAARSYHVVTADGFDTLKAAAFHSGGDTCAAGLLTQLGKPGTCGIHPSYAGQALLSQALLEAIRI